MPRRVFLRVLQAITLALFVIVFSYIIASFSAGTWQVTSLLYILGAIKNLVSYVLYIFMSTVAWLAGSLFHLGLGIPYQYLFEWTIEPLFFQFLNTMFHMTNETGVVVTYSSFREVWIGHGFGPERIAPIYELMIGQVMTILGQFYMLLFIICLIVAVLNMLLFVAKSDIKHALYSSLSMIAPVLIALFPQALIAMGDLTAPLIITFARLFITDTPITDEIWVNFKVVFNTYVASVTIFERTGILLDDIGPLTFFLEPGVLFAFLLYGFLELSFQTSYVARVTQPSIQRTKRLESQIAALGQRSSILELEKAREIQEKTVRSRFLVGAPKQAPTSSEDDVEKKGALRSFFTGGGITAVRDLIERREKERERERLEDITADTRRLDTYIKRLFETDKTAKRSLTALGSAPSRKNMLTSTLLSIGIRLGVMLGLTFVLANPIIIFSVFNSPPVITESVGFQSAEAIITVLVPIVLLFPIIAFIIRIYKKYRLQVVKQKLSKESDYLRRLSELKRIEAEEALLTDEGNESIPMSPGG